MGQVLPPGVARAAWSSALDALRGELGADAVLDADDALAAYLDPFAPGDARRFCASAAVLPANVGEIRTVLAWAHRTQVPLWSVSTGRNFAYGGAAPRVSGSVVLDLRRMNRVLDVDDTLGYALVEPGVTYFDLHEALRARGSALWVDPPAAGWGSVVGNTLERGFGTTPYGDHAAAQCGMEIILANGDIVRTGMGAMSRTTSWQVFKSGFGPSYDTLFMQSNFGIVTKMGLWLMPRPDGYRLGHFRFRHDDDLAAIVDTLRPLKLDDTIQSHVAIDHAVRWGAGIAPRRRWYDGPGPMPDTAIDAMVRALGIGRWNLRFGLYGPEDLVEARLRTIRRAFATLADAELDATDYAHATSEPEGGGDRSQVGIPNMSAFQMLNWRGGQGAHLDFSPVCPTTGHDARAQYTMVRSAAHAAGFDYYGGFTVAGRHMHHIFAAIFDKDDAAQARAAHDLVEALIRQTGDAGYGQYRAHLAFMDLAASQYDFNDHALMRLNDTIKRALDPQGVLSPGKQGILPARFRS
ncbi:FAD-binding oxidoreductase [Pararobbsia silviterrae]|uniref:FAD-binding oxidoreductase n=1 Tax=Pararobbsia silviterrae TaxID=1792498 RepID=A0A494Y2N6_9BURK|nr:FAD-binding oxidoreductase [Pararobbsia silviterrae]RKP55723.1 FAD-binding oxidoreductase [Pararobbsia silviterrae]